MIDLVGKGEARYHCKDELRLLEAVAEYLTQPDASIGDFAAKVQTMYPNFLDTYKVAKLMNPHWSPVRQALRAAKLYRPRGG